MSRELMRAGALFAAIVLLATGCGRSAGVGAEPRTSGMSGGASTAAATIDAQISAAETADIAALPAGPGHDIVLANCITCHSAGMILQQRKDSAGWARTVGQMVSWGVVIPDAQRPVLMSYLQTHFGTSVAAK